MSALKWTKKYLNQRYFCFARILRKSFCTINERIRGLCRGGCALVLLGVVKCKLGIGYERCRGQFPTSSAMRTASDAMGANRSAWKISTFFTRIRSTKFKHCACIISKPTSVNTIQRWYPRRTELAGRLPNSIRGLSTQKESSVEKCAERS